MASTRRLAAILAADMVGYSRLMGLDEAGTATALREHRAAAVPLIAQQRGRIVKTTGDGLLIEFGSVVGAVECALALQHLAAERDAAVASDRRMEWRIGVHLGDVLIEGDDILGDGVNIAARIGYRQCVLVLRRVNPDKRFGILFMVRPPRMRLGSVRPSNPRTLTARRAGRRPRPRT